MRTGTMWRPRTAVKAFFPLLLMALAFASGGCPAPGPEEPSVKSFTINGGASTTATRQVTLAGTCVNVPAEYVACENAGFPDVPWRPFAAQLSFTLSAGEGPKTVYFKVRNAAGESAFVADFIVLDEPDGPAPPVVTAFTLNEGAVITRHDEVTFSSTCTGSPTHYQVSEAHTFAGAAWLPYAPSAPFTLSAGQGVKTVYFRARNAYGDSPAAWEQVRRVVPLTPEVTAFGINNNAPATATRSVTLNNVCTNAPAEYQAGESPSFNGISWKVYTPAPAFTLSAGGGTKTVYLRTRNSHGESETVSDTISLTLAPGAPTLTAFALNGGAASTASQTVTLIHTCTGNPTEYLASESSAFTGAMWQTYSTAPVFQLSAGGGTKTVYLKTRNAYGESNTLSDTIVRDASNLPVITSFLINGDAAATSERTVTLNHVCTGVPTEYSVGESADLVGSLWLPYDAAPAFELSNGDGRKTVYFSVRNANGESNVVSDSIVVQGTTHYVFERMWPRLPHPWYFSCPSDLAVDSRDNLYVCDPLYCRILKFSSNGTFLVKWGSEGSGDGQFKDLLHAAVDIVGNVYVADYGNRRIQKFDSNGTFLTKWNAYWGEGFERFVHPRDIDVDAVGNVYLSNNQSSNGSLIQCIQKFTSDGEFLSEWGHPGAGNGQFLDVRGLAVDVLGNVYLSDIENHRIQKFASSGTYLTQWSNAGLGSPGTTTHFGDMSVDTNDDIYVTALQSASDGSRPSVLWVQKFDADGHFITKWTDPAWEGDDTHRWADLDSSVAADSMGNVYFAFDANDRIQKFDTRGTTVNLVASWGSSGPGGGQFRRPHRMAVNSSGEVYVIDAWNHQIQKFTADGAFLTQWGSFGYEDGQFAHPRDIAVDASGKVYVADGDRLQVFSGNGTFLTKWAVGWLDRSSYYGAIAMDASGHVYVLYGAYVRKYAMDGTLLTQWSREAPGTRETGGSDGLVADVAGNVYVSDFMNSRILKFSADGALLAQWGSSGSGDGQFRFEWDSTLRPEWNCLLGHTLSLSLDTFGNVYVADPGNHRIQKFAPDGTFLGKWGGAGVGESKFNRPCGVALSPSGNVYVADTHNNRIQKFRPE